MTNVEPSTCLRGLFSKDDDAVHPLVKNDIFKDCPDGMRFDTKEVRTFPFCQSDVNACSVLVCCSVLLHVNAICCSACTAPGSVSRQVVPCARAKQGDVVQHPLVCIGIFSAIGDRTETRCLKTGNRRKRVHPRNFNQRAVHLYSIPNERARTVGSYGCMSVFPASISYPLGISMVFEERFFFKSQREDGTLATHTNSCGEQKRTYETGIFRRREDPTLPRT